MNRHGALDIHDAFAQRSTAAAAPVTAAAPLPQTTANQAVDGEIVVPIVEEELAVGKRQIQRGGVRVFQRVEERPVDASVTLREENVTVERHAVNRPVTGSEAAFGQTADLVITTTEEVPVVSKQARVVEEVVVGKTETERTETVRDTVRRTDVEIDEAATDPSKRI